MQIYWWMINMLGLLLAYFTMATSRGPDCLRTRIDVLICFKSCMFTPTFNLLFEAAWLLSWSSNVNLQTRAVPKSC